jgi:peptidoglycan hydrolase CwlO-like protein
MDSVNLCISDIDTIKTYIDSARFHIAVIDAELDDRQAEIEKLNSIIDELRDENERLKQAAKGGEA